MNDDKMKAVATSNNLKGLSLALLACAVFALALALVKQLGADIHVLQIVFFRQVIVFVSTLPVIAKSFPQNLKTRRPGVHIVRLLGAFVAISTGIWSVTLLPLATATTLAFSQVLFVAILASLVLGETVGLARAGAIALGFVGVGVAMEPDFDGLVSIQALIPIFGAMGAATAVVCVRKLSQTESKATLLAYQAIFVGLLSGIPLIWLWKTPTHLEFQLLGLVGLLATLGQWIGVSALKLGEANVVGQAEYSKLIYTGLLGYLVFSELPSISTCFGAGLIISSSLSIIRKEMKTPMLAMDGIAARAGNSSFSNP